MNFTVVVQILLMLFTLLPQILNAAKEVYEAFEVSGSDATAEVKIQAAVEAGIACYEIADKQFNLSDELDNRMKTQLIPAVAGMLFYGGSNGQ